MTATALLDVTVQAVAAALLHSLWQGTLVAAVTAVLWRTLRGGRPNVRYAVGCVALMLMVAAWAGTAWRTATQLIPEASVAGHAPPALLGPAGPFDFSPAIRPITRAELEDGSVSWGGRLERWSVRIVPLWLVGVFGLSFRLAASWWLVQRLRRAAWAPVAPLVADRAGELARRLRIARAIRIVQSRVVQVPAVVGWLRPVVLLPGSALTGLSPAQLDAVIAHELAHVRRHDFAVNLLQSAVEILLFYHPACWWISRRVRTERELCCDDVAVWLCGDRLAYAAALADLETLRQQPALRLAATDGPLLRRVKRLVAPPEPDAPPAWGALALPLAVVVIVIGGVVATRAQQAPEQARTPGMSRAIPGDRGIVEGRVVEAATGQPVAGARVDVRGSSDQEYVTTDQAGRYTTRPLTPGAYSVSATATGHAIAFYNGRAGSISGLSMQADGVSVSGSITLTGLEVRPSITVGVRPGTVISNIDVAMQANGQLSGRILDDRGRGLPGANIELSARPGASAAILPRAAYAQTDADGIYRVAAPPGDYVIRADIPTRVRPSGDASLAYLATFYPGVRSQDAAQVVHIDAGSDLYDVDFALLPSRTVRVSGTIVDPAGASLEGVKVSLRAVRSSSGERSVDLAMNRRGEFNAADVVPGTYLVDVTDPVRPARWTRARPPLEITEDVIGLEIRAVPAASITGRIVRDPRSSGQPHVSQTLVALVSQVAAGAGGMNMTHLTIEEDGSFYGDVPTGPVTVLVTGRPGWSTRSVAVDGVEMFGRPLEVTSGAHEIEVVLTDRLASVSGQVVDRRGTPIGGFDVLLFPPDETGWFFGSPFVHQTRSRQDGQFELSGVPPGDYLAVATEGVPFLMLGNPEPTLRRLQSIGTRLKVIDAEQKIISIRASPSPPAP